MTKPPGGNPRATSKGILKSRLVQEGGNPPRTGTPFTAKHQGVPKLSRDSTALDPTGVTGRQGEPERRTASLRDTRRALLAGAVSVHEARVHAALALEPELKGLSTIEMRSGLGRMTLCGDPRRGTPGVIPAEGCSSVLLHCESRGVFTIVEDERRPMQVQALPFSNSSSADHHSYEISPSLFLREGGVGGDDLVGKDLGTRNGPQMTSSGEAPWIERYEKLLSPDRDVWANRPVSNREALGDAGWVIALAYGFEAVQAPLKDLQRLLGKSAQQTQRIMDKLGFARTKGRGALVAVDLSYFADSDTDNLDHFSGCALRAGQKNLTAHLKREATARRGTQHGYAAYRVAHNREMVAAVIADPTWRSRVLELDEKQLANELERYCQQHEELPQWARELLWAHRQHRARGELARGYVEALEEEDTDYDREGLRAMALKLIDAEVADFFRWATEPADVPDSPEVLEPAPAEEGPLAQAARQGSLSAEPGLSEERADRIAAMRRRLIDEQTTLPRQRAVSQVPEKRAEDAERMVGETEDDHKLRTVCAGDPKLFRNVYGRLPNQPRPEPTERELKRRRAREAVEERRLSREQARA